MGATALLLDLLLERWQPSEERWSARGARVLAGWSSTMPASCHHSDEPSCAQKQPLAEEAGILGVLLHFKYNQSSKLPRRSTKRVQTIKKD